MIKRVAAFQKAKSASVGTITLPPSTNSSAGIGLRKQLVEHLREIGVTVKAAGGELGIQGRVVEREKNELTLKLEFTEIGGEPLTILNKELSGDESEPAVIIRNGCIDLYLIEGAGAAELLGLPWSRKRGQAGSGTPAGSEAMIDDKMTARMRGQNNLFGMRILVLGRPRALKMEDGFPFVDLRKGDEFEIQIDNSAAFDIAVTLHLDGVNSFAFSQMLDVETKRPRYSKWIIPRRSTVQIKGWHRTNDLVNKFRVTDLLDSALAELGQPNTESVGLITATIRATWTAGQRPRDEPEPPPTMGAPLGAAIGRGETQNQFVREDRAKREYGVVRAIVPIRYNKE
jgi:hypothetical protein